MSSYRVTRAALTGLCRLIAQQWEAEYGHDTTPARLIAFPKRVYELPFTSGTAPGGLSVQYVELAAQFNRNDSASTENKTALQTLLRALEEIVAEAVITERRLIQELNKTP